MQKSAYTSVGIIYILKEKHPLCGYKTPPDINEIIIGANKSINIVGNINRTIGINIFTGAS